MREMDIDAEVGVHVTFVVIGYKEAENLRDSIRAVKQVSLAGRVTELFYVDGGSDDDSVQIAQGMGVDRVLGGDQRRSAAQNRNLGLRVASGNYVQFIDGDMEMNPAWPAGAMALLDDRPDVAVV
jgi:glycosyltransferase involved in cell wall biosynthesis